MKKKDCIRIKSVVELLMEQDNINEIFKKGLRENED